MRHTLHLLTVEDLGWLLPLLGPIFIRASQRRRTTLGLDEETCARGIHVLRNALAEEGPLTRSEIVERLAARGIRLEGQARPHLIGRAALEGFVCLGPDRGSEPTYVLLGDWVDPGRALPRDAALAELARRYIGAYGPAGPEDLAAWSGLPVGEARAAWKLVADRLVEVEVAGKTAWMPKERTAWLEEPPPRYPLVRLLPKFDTYLLGYRGRDPVAAPEYAKRIHPGGGILRPTLLVDGRALGIWNFKRLRDRLEVIVDPFEDLTSSVRAGLEAEIADLAHFLGTRTELTLAPETNPRTSSVRT